MIASSVEGLRGSLEVVQRSSRVDGKNAVKKIKKSNSKLKGLCQTVPACGLKEKLRLHSQIKAV